MRRIAFLVLVMAAPVVHGGHIYGIHVGGQLRCLDALTGNAIWETTAATHGRDESVLWSTAFIVPHEPPGAAADDGRRDAATPFRAFIANERGELIVAEL